MNQERIELRYFLWLFFAGTFAMITVGMFPYIQEMVRDGLNLNNVVHVVFLVILAGIASWVFLKYYHDEVNKTTSRVTKFLNSATKVFVSLAVITLPFSLVATIIVAVVLRNGLVFLPLATLVISTMVLAIVVTDYLKAGKKKAKNLPNNRS